MKLSLIGTVLRTLHVLQTRESRLKITPSLGQPLCPLKNHYMTQIAALELLISVLICRSMWFRFSLASHYLNVKIWALLASIEW